MKVRCSAQEYAKDYLRCADADGKERRLLIEALERSIDGREDEESYCSVSVIPLESGSTLEYVHTSLSTMLKEIMSLPLVAHKICGRLEHYRIVIGLDGGLEAVGPENRFDLTAICTCDEAMSERLSNLEESVKTIAEVCLGPIVDAENWLRFHGFAIPETVSEVKDLLALFQWTWPTQDNLGNYWEYFTGGTESTLALTAPQFEEIRAVTAQLSPQGQSLLDVLCEDFKSNLPSDLTWDNANDAIAMMLGSKLSKLLARKYIEALGWYGADEDEQVHDEDLAQILVTALILDLDPSLGTQQERNRVGTHDLYGTDIATDKRMAEVRNSLESYLVESGCVPWDLKALASHLLLAFMAPGFLVKDLPDLAVGSLGWLTFSQAVALVEMSVTGASRSMTYGQVMEFARIASASSTLAKLQGFSAIDPVIDWALINDVVCHEELLDPSTQAQERALSAYEKQMETLAFATQTISTPLPSRMKLARATLREAAPGCTFLEEKILRHYKDPTGFLEMASVFTLYVEGRLTQAWDTFEDDLFVRYPGLKGLEQNQPVFEAKVYEYHCNYHEALASNIKLAMSTMPAQHREIFQTSEIHFFTVRPYVAEKKYFGDPGFTGGNASKPIWLETQRKRDEATGRYGIILYVALSEDEFLCYEQFYLSGVVRINEQLGASIHRFGLTRVPARLDFDRGLDDWLPAMTWYKYPLDFNAYTKGAESPTAPLEGTIIDRLGCIPAPEDHFSKKNCEYQSFVHPQIDRVATFITTKHPLASAEELKIAATELTESEALNEKREHIIQCVIDLVIPFKKCIEDISSGEKDKIKEGIWGCALDALGIIATVLGLPLKVMNLAGRTYSLVTKTAKLAKYVFALVGSTLNPLDGLPTAVYRSSKFIFKSGIQLTGEGLELLEKATYKVRRLSGKAKSFDLVQCSKGTPLELGSWRPRGNSVEVLNVCALRQNTRWFAVNRHGRAWGKSLTNFTFMRVRTLPGRLSKAFPTGFARQIVQRSLPTAVHKFDNALTALASSQLNREAETIINLFLGSGKSREKFEVLLQVVKLDIGNIAVRNFVLNNVQINNDTFALRQADFNAWKTVGGENDQPFLEVSTQNLIERFASAHSNYGEIADDLIHAIFQAHLSKDNVAQAMTMISDRAGVDVAPLLNLARGVLVKEDGQGLHDYFDRRRAALNADSFAIVTALLSQLVTHEALAKENLFTLVAVIDEFTDKPIDVEVLINLNLNVIETPIIPA